MIKRVLTIAKGVFGNVIISENFLETFGKQGNQTTTICVQLLMKCV